MSSKKIYLAFAIIAFSSVTILATARGAIAQKYPEPMRTIEAALPEIVVDKDYQSTLIANEKAANVDDVALLLSKWEEKKIKYSQWLHLVYKVTFEVDRGVTLPDGSALPSSYVQDDWYYINEDGLVDRSVKSMKDDAGNVLQQTAFQNGISVNFTFDERTENTPSYQISIALGFDDYIQDAKNLSLPIVMSTDKVKQEIKFSILKKYEKPKQFGNESFSVVGLKTNSHFNAETGELIAMQTIWILDDGREILFDSAQFITIENFPNAPDEILKVLESVK